jgi:PPK2 family polyphosphate:nucleotide phosphotransferase
MVKLPARKLLERYRITDGRTFRLAEHATDDVAPKLISQSDSAALLAQGVARLSELQEQLYAHRSWSLLAVFQAIDAAGKDGTIKHVMSGVNPQGVKVKAFKAPGEEELGHDFLWRVMRELPERGQVGIFNRSHYEEVLVVRVHPEILDRQHLPERVRGKKLFKHRLQDIAHFESYLARQGTVVLKFFLHVSREEQRRRLLERLDKPSKNWKFSTGDVIERQHWPDYMDAYEDAIRATASPQAPWFVVPADNKWFTRLVVVAAMIDALEQLDLKPPQIPEQALVGLAAARAELMKEE